LSATSFHSLVHGWRFDVSSVLTEEASRATRLFDAPNSAKLNARNKIIGLDPGRIDLAVCGQGSTWTDGVDNFLVFQVSNKTYHDKARFTAATLKRNQWKASAKVVEAAIPLSRVSSTVSAYQYPDLKTLTGFYGTRKQQRPHFMATLDALKRSTKSLKSSYKIV